MNDINGLIIIKTLICKIPPNLSWLKGVPRFAGFDKEGRACLPVGRGRFSNDYVNSILGPFINECSHFLFLTPSPVMGTKITGRTSVLSTFPGCFTIFLRACE